MLIVGFLFSPKKVTEKTPNDQQRKTFRIRCPKCDWQPAREDQWSCAPGCGHVWNTFDTRGVCPGCDKQWVQTMCLRCDVWSAHDDWYEEEGS